MRPPNMRKRLALGLCAALFLPLGGCSALGSLLSGVGQLVGTVLQLALALAGPALAYYLYKRNKD